MPVGFTLPSSEYENVVGIQFGIFSPDEIVKRSVVEITTEKTYDGAEPRIGGLFDPRMGVLENGKTCRSCGQTNHNCPGHFGHYRLARPVYFYQFKNMIMSVLKCVCIRCSKLLIDKEAHSKLLKRRGESRWREVLNLCDNVTRCGQHTEDGCGTVQPSRYVIERIATIVAEWDDVRQVLDVEYVQRLFRQITDEDVDFMGFSRHWCRPDWMICSVLPIPPPQVRPSVIQDNNQRSEDDLTHKLFEIIRTNRTLQDKIDNNADRKFIEEYTGILQYHIATLVDNKIPGVPPSAQRGGRPLKSLQQRIGSKEGRMRYNIQGKRVEQSARTVITPDPNLSIAEVGVPIKIAMNLSRPERVTQFNREKLYKYVQNGTDVFPGAKSIIRKDGRMISLKHVNTKEIQLYDGDIVNRHLMDGDILLFNRQPTLHRMSMMGHRVRVLPYNTFRLNVSVCSAYNADFDGDEMNAHLPQSSEAIVELEDIAAVPWQIVRPRDAKPIIDIVQDTLVGSYLATKPNNSFNRREFMNLMMWNKRFSQLPAAMQDPETNKTYYNGAQIISSLLPPVNISTKTKLGPLEIEEGNLKKGLLSKPAFNQPGSGIVHTTFNDYGPMEAVKLIDSLQTVLESYLIMKGFSVGVSDLIADEKTRKDMEEVIKQKKQQIEQIILQVHMDLFTNNTGKTNQEEFESRIFAILNKAVDEAGKLGENSLAEENRLICMVRAGSKGSTVNIAQMIACVGQQNVEGKRTPYGFTDRTLPHYKKYDDGAESRGFVESSFVRGLNPQEFFFHAMSGREGLIDTAVKTSETGYTQRRLIKAMEDLMVQHDGTVRDANNNIIQFYYGEDGLNSTKIEMTELKLQEKSDGDLAKMYGLEGVDITSILQPSTVRENDSQLLADFVAQGKEDRTMIVERLFHGARTGDIFGPLNLDRIIFNLKIKFRLNNQAPTDLTPRMIIEGIQQIIDRTYPYNKTWCALLRYHLCPYNILVEKRFTKEAWDTLVNMVITKVWKAGSVPGELVGIIAAQSIGEPTTQMSCIGSTKITVHGKDFAYDGPIDKFIDSMMEKNKEKLLSLGNDSLVYDPEDNYYIAGVSNDEKSSWNRILQVSRHPANGKLVEVKTRSGRITTATLSHSFLKRSEKGIEAVKGSDLMVGDRIPVAKYVPIVPNPIQEQTIGNQTVQCNYEFGWVCGLYLNDGLIKDDSIVFSHYEPYIEERLQAFAKSYNYPLRVNVIESEFGTVKNFVLHSSALQDYFSENFGKELYRKEMSGAIFHMNYEFLRGLLSGCFDSAGNIHGDRQLIRFTMTSKVLSQQIAKLCTYFGFFGSFGEEVNVEKRQYVYMILRKYAKEILEVVRIHNDERAKELQLIVDYNNRDNVHSNMELIDKLPYCGRLIAETATILHMPSCSRIYRRWLKKESVGRETLRKYIRRFNHALETNKGITLDDRATVTENVKLLQQATESDVVWDEITELNMLEDPKTYVYDFTVPGNDSFMVDDSIYVHNTLNTFHLAGVAAKSNMTRGVPRLKELLQVTHNPKATSLTVYLKPEFCENKDRVREVIQDLEITLLKDITLKAGIYYDPKDEESIVEEDRELIQFFRAFESLESKEDDDNKWNKWMLRLEFDREKMFNRNITMDDVHYVLKERFADDVHMVYSDYNSSKLIMRIRIVDSDPLLHDDLNSLKKFQNRILNNIVIRGVPGIRAVTFRKSKEMHVLKDGKYEQVEQYVLDTDGSNFLEVMNHPAIDGNRIYSTNVHDIYEQLGIEAARKVLYSEMAGLFEEAGINYRHLCLLVDVMTHPGRLISVDRYGINKNDNGPLAKACFEETDKILRKAAQFGEIDPVTGVSANVMTGQTIRGGTAFSQILLDEEALPALLANEPLIQHYDEPEDILTDRNIQAALVDDSNDMCSQTRLSMNINLPVGTSNMEDEEDIEIITV